MRSPERIALCGALQAPPPTRRPGPLQSLFNRLRSIFR
jgi:hypothetical protein